MYQVNLMFEDPGLALVNTLLLVGIVLAAVAIPALNRITDKQSKRNEAMRKANSRHK